MMIECCDAPTNHHNAIFEKYSERRFKEASTIVQAALDAGFTVPPYNLPARFEHPPAPPATFDMYSEQLYSDFNLTDDVSHSHSAQLIPV
jgi:G2/mitotic-specific cyclin 3/4